MAMYIYQTDGRPVGFRFNNCIHDLTGTPLGRVLGTHVYRFDGSYVGELFKEMVVSKPVDQIPAVHPVAVPPAARSPGISFQRRGVVNYGFPDAFPLFYEPPVALAAE